MAIVDTNEIRNQCVKMPPRTRILLYGDSRNDEMGKLSKQPRRFSFECLDRVREMKQSTEHLTGLRCNIISYNAYASHASFTLTISVLNARDAMPHIILDREVSQWYQCDLQNTANRGCSKNQVIVVSIL